MAVVFFIRHVAWERDASVAAKPARWFDRLKLYEVEVADGPQGIGGSAILLIVRQCVQPSGILRLQLRQFGDGIMPAPGPAEPARAKAGGGRRGGARDSPALRRRVLCGGGPGAPRRSWASHRSICVAWFHSEA